MQPAPATSHPAPQDKNSGWAVRVRDDGWVTRRAEAKLQGMLLLPSV